MEVKLIIIVCLLILVFYLLLARKKQAKTLDRIQIEYEKLLAEFSLSYGISNLEDFPVLVRKMQAVFHKYESIGIVITDDPKARLENSLLHYFQIRSSQQTIHLPSFKGLVSEVLQERYEYSTCVINPLQILHRMIKELRLKDKLDIAQNDFKDFSTEAGRFILSIIAKDIPALKKTLVSKESFIPSERDKVETRVLEESY